METHNDDNTLAHDDNPKELTHFLYLYILPCTSRKNMFWSILLKTHNMNSLENIMITLFQYLLVLRTTTVSYS